MLEETILGATVGTAIFLFFIINYSLSERRYKTERAVRLEKPNIPCPQCGTLLGSSDQFCSNCSSLRLK